MKIQAIRENSIALLTDFDELNSRGIQMKTLNGQNTADMIRQSFIRLGMDANGSIDIETYINGRAVLIFAHISKATTEICALFRFNSLETLISAAHLLDENAPSSLLFADGGYYLVLHGSEGQASIDFLSEYGDPEPACKLRYAHLHDHGKLICQGNAVNTIRRNFHSAHPETSYFADSLNSSD